MFRPGHADLYAGLSDGDVLQIDPRTGHSGATFVGDNGQVYGLAISPDARLLAAGTENGSVVLWDLKTRQRLGDPLVGPTDIVSGLAFTTDGTQLLAGSSDNTTTLWDVDPLSWERRACAEAGRTLSKAEWRQYLGSRSYQPPCTGGDTAK